MKENYTIKIVGIAGSLREGSFNRALLQTARTMLPAGMQLKIYDLNTLPLYNDDIISAGSPPSVAGFRDVIGGADGLLIAATEYNYSISGVLKNALDWASTNGLGNILQDKPIAIMGASTMMFGTTHSQRHLRQVLHAVNARVLGRPEVFLPKAREAFSQAGELQDERFLKRINDLLLAFRDLIISSQ